MKFIPFVTAGYPNPSLFKKIIFLLEQEGAAMIEIGVPYSDPLADGPTIQKSSLRAIEQGFNLSKSLEIIEELRNEGLKVPLILFSYYNPLLQMGLVKMAERLQQIRCQGLIVPDLPYEESGPIQQILNSYQIPLISLISPSTEKERADLIASQAKGFVYIVSSFGVTGVRSSFHNNITSVIKNTKKMAKVPVVLGFGIKQKFQVKELQDDLDGYVIGSALINKIEEIESELAPITTEKVKFEQELIERLRTAVKEMQQ